MLEMQQFSNEMSLIGKGVYGVSKYLYSPFLYWTLNIVQFVIS